MLESVLADVEHGVDVGIEGFDPLLSRVICQSKYAKLGEVSGRRPDRYRVNRGGTYSLSSLIPLIIF